MKARIWITWLQVAVALISDLVPVSAQDPQVWTEWHNSLAPQGTPSAPVTLASNGRSDYWIVVPAAATTQDLKAAGDLQYWLQQMTGVQLPVVTEGTPLEDHWPISVGRTALLAQSGLPAASVDLGDEGYGIAEQGGSLFLWGGRTRGAINAVYALLEEDLGCRWYTADHFRIQSQPALTFSPVERTYKPALKLRDPFYYVAFNEDWSLRNRTNAPYAPVREEWGGHVDYDGMFVHTFSLLLPPSQYFAAHPEYYMMDASGNRMPSSLCTTNPDVRQLVTQRVRQILASNPHLEIISVSKNDTHATCLCPNCKALDDAEGSGMGSLLYLVNYVAEQIEADYPNVLIDTLAYFDTLGPPLTIRPRQNVVVRICNTESWSAPFLPMEQNAFGPLLESWAVIHDKISVWDYTVNFWHYLAPMPNMHVIGADIPYMAGHSVIGIMTQGGYQCTSERDTMRAWVIAKLLWDPSRDWYQMQQDFIWGHFGCAAGRIAEYNDLLHNQYVLYANKLKRPSGGIRFPMDSIFLTADFLNAAGALFDQAESLAENTDILNRIQRERLAIMYVWLERGPDFTGPTYGPLIDRFETIARREGATFLKERSTPNLDEKLQEWRGRWQDYLHVAINPSPADHATDVAPPTLLTWTARQSSSTYNVYFGTVNPPQFQRSQTGTTFDPGPLPPLRTWFWRIDSVDPGRTTVGATWTFSTRISPDFDGDVDVDQADFGHLQVCLTGHLYPISDPNCQDADLNDDNHVDVRDLSIFLGCMSGASRSRDPDCMN